MDHPMSLRVLVKHCTVRLLVQGIGAGTGFFVAPGLVLTCAHVIAEAYERQLPVVVHTWDGHVLGQTLVAAEDVLLENIPVPEPHIDGERVHKYPDLALLRLEQQDHSCVYLAESIGERDPLFSYGYVQDYASGEEAQFTYEGEGWIDGQRRLLKFSEGQVTHGLSGGPLVNERTGSVCGIVQRTRGSKSALGGRAIPVQTALASFPELSALQQQFHQADARWLTSLTPAQQQTLAQTTIHLIQPKPPSTTDPIIMDIARYLQRRRDLPMLTVLFLGARTGGLYGNRALADELSVAKDLAPLEQFRACYKALQRFNRDTIHDILQLALKQAPFKRADQQVAELVRQGYFDVVISTNLDVSLDRAMDRERLLAPPFDPRLVICDGQNVDAVIREERERSKIIKIFGNVDGGLGAYHTVGHELELDIREYTPLKEYLQKTLLESIVVLGYDPLWDRPLERAFLERQGGNIYYINEEQLDEQTTLARAIQKRQGSFFTGEQGAYSICIEQLYQMLIATGKT